MDWYIISNEIAVLENQIKNKQDMLDKIRDKCLHSTISERFNNTDNVSVSCPDCGKYFYRYQIG